MPKGGARVKSGPPKDPDSRTSDRVGYRLTALPSEGYRGDVPDLTDFLPAPTAREDSIWSRLWTTPQACAWSLEPWRWATVADLAMFRARADAPDSPAALANSIKQLRDELGLSKAGLAYNGWAVAKDELAEKVQERAAEEQPKQERRLRSADAQR